MSDEKNFILGIVLELMRDDVGGGELNDIFL